MTGPRCETCDGDRCVGCNDEPDASDGLDRDDPDYREPDPTAPLLVSTGAWMALKERAEAAEASVAHWVEAGAEYAVALHAALERADAAEARVAELEGRD